MTGIGAFFLIVIVALTVSQIFITRGYLRYRKLYAEYNYLLNDSAEKENKIQDLVDSGFFDSAIFNVDKFNEWFKNNKDKSIYAHAGIYLRTDKLSRVHIDDYISVITNGVISGKDFEELKIFKFEDKIRKNWIKQLHSK
jgi:hypothetical protein